MRALAALAAVLAAPMSQARCELETSALSKQEGVQRLCAALSQCVSAEGQESAGASALRTAAFAQTARLEQQVALLSKEKAQLLQTAQHDALVTTENSELVHSVDALEQRVTDDRAHAAKAKDAAAVAAAAESGAAKAAASARRSAEEVVTLKTQLAAAEKDAVAADAQRGKLEAAMLREAGVAAKAVREGRTAQADAAKAHQEAKSVESADAVLVKRLATAEAAVQQLTSERAAVEAAATAAAQHSAAALKELQAKLHAMTEERDEYRDQAIATAKNCKHKVEKLKADQQKELARIENELNR